MLKRELEVEIGTETWPTKKAIPKMFRKASKVEDLDLAKAFLMLGTITMPSLLSPASPARFWAWLRYLVSLTDTDDLRITMDFADLDPHQKGILSDDFGVAISTQWLFDRLKGFAEIVDGRRFILQFPHLIRRPKPGKAKVGPGKSPDFVVRDLSGKWHVLECKGTQSGYYWRNKFLKNAHAQKRVIKIVGHMRGEQLAAGLAIANEEDDKQTQLRIEDPDGEPEITLGDRQEGEANEASRRLGIARALGAIGLNEVAMDLWLPVEAADFDDLLRPSEAFRLWTGPSRAMDAAADHD